MGKGNRMKVFVAFSIVIGIGVLMLWNLLSTRPNQQEESIARGQIVYDKSCAVCHGVNLEGQENWRIINADGTFPAPPHDIEGHTWHHDDQLLFDMTKYGGEAAMALRGVDNFKSGMPGFGDVLTDEQINDVWVFIKSTWTDRERNSQAERTAAQQELADD